MTRIHGPFLTLFFILGLLQPLVAAAITIPTVPVGDVATPTIRPPAISTAASVTPTTSASMK